MSGGCSGTAGFQPADAGRQEAGSPRARSPSCIIDTAGEITPAHAALGRRAKNEACRVLARWGSSSQWAMRTTLRAAAVSTCCRCVLAQAAIVGPVQVTDPHPLGNGAFH